MQRLNEGQHGTPTTVGKLLHAHPKFIEEKQIKHLGECVDTSTLKAKYKAFIADSQRDEKAAGKKKAKALTEKDFVDHVSRFVHLAGLLKMVPPADAESYAEGWRMTLRLMFSHDSKDKSYVHSLLLITGLSNPCPLVSDHLFIAFWRSTSQVEITNRLRYNSPFAFLH